ncbi:cytochrome b, partial [Acinetobacter pittii]|nr:cytochrome b [Acinetobacter pittii]
WIYRDGVFSSMALGSSKPSSNGSSAEKKNAD